jgi:hypothetical protein
MVWSCRPCIVVTEDLPVNLISTFKTNKKRFFVEKNATIWSRYFQFHMVRLWQLRLQKPETRSLCSLTYSLYSQQVRKLVPLFMLQITVNNPFYYNMENISTKSWQINFALVHSGDGILFRNVCAFVFMCLSFQIIFCNCVVLHLCTICIWIVFVYCLYFQWLVANEWLLSLVSRERMKFKITCIPLRCLWTIELSLISNYESSFW